MSRNLIGTCVSVIISSILYIISSNWIFLMVGLIFGLIFLMRAIIRKG